MKRKTIFLLVLVMSFLNMAAENNNKQISQIEVSYKAHAIGARTGKIHDLDMILLSGNARSKYFNPVSQSIDSLKSTPEGYAKWRQMTQAAVIEEKWDDMPINPTFEYVFKSFPDRETTLYDGLGMGFVKYSEPFSEQKWIVGDSTETILGYECLSAMCDYHGRTWTAWFATDIPVQDGPWKFCGLPGLILKVEDSEGMYWFEATGIEQNSKVIQPMYNPEKYEKISRKDFYKTRRKLLENPFGAINAQMPGMSVTSPAPETPASFDYIETDYH